MKRLLFKNEDFAKSYDFYKTSVDEINRSQSLDDLLLHHAKVKNKIVMAEADEPIKDKLKGLIQVCLQENNNMKFNLME